MAQNGRNPWETIVTGFIIAAGFGIYWAVNPDKWWPVFPLVFAGALPFVHGVQRLMAERRSRPTAAEREAQIEKEILRIAQRSGGTITPALVALESELTTEGAEKTLQKMAQRGYASMRVTDEGRVVYEFPEFSVSKEPKPGDRI